jgi:hypothetical protein
MMGIFEGHGVFSADFVHWIRGCVTRLFDAGHEVRLTAAGTPITRQTIADRVAGALVVGLFHENRRLNWKMQDYPACLMFSMANFMLAQNHFREYAQWLLPGTLLQIVMRVEFVSRATKFTLLEMLHIVLQRLLASRHDGGQLADRLETRRRAMFGWSNDQLVREGSLLMILYERLKESVDCDVDVSREGTKRLEQEFSRLRRPLNNNDADSRFLGRITRVLLHDLETPVAEPRETDPQRHAPVGGGIIRARDV